MGGSLWIALAVLFVGRSRRFPAAVTTVLLFWFVLLMLDVVVFGVRHVLVPVQFVALAVLVSYLRRSTRVRATFVR